MNPVKKKLAVAMLSGGSIAAILGGTALVRDSSVARADNAPDQGKVQKPIEVSPQEREHLDGLASIFRKVGKSVEPSVVNIEVVKSGKATRPPGYEEMLRRMFPDRDGDGEPDLPEGLDGDGSEFKQQGTGSGVVMEVSGSDVYILTNNHVAGGATEMRVTLADGRRIEDGTLVGADPKSDLAVVKIKADNLIAAPWGDSDKLEKGDWIMAFGSPFGYVGSMTHGIVSALNRRAGILGTEGYENFIQVDAPINPGNSGGPLVNIRGEVVGINTAIASRTGGFQGIGFAIPSNQAKFVYTALKTNGKVVRGYLGVKISDVSSDRDKARTFGFQGDEGVLIEQSFPDTPATGKLMPGDIITTLAGEPVKGVQELRNTIAATPPGTDLKLTVFRQGKNEDVTIKIGEQPEHLQVIANRPTGDPAAKADGAGNVLGMTLVTPTEALAKEFVLGETRQGALVAKVEPESPAAKAGLQKGDVITHVFDEDVLTAKQAAEEIGKADPAKPIRLYVANSEGSRFVVVKPTGS